MIIMTVVDASTGKAKTVRMSQAEADFLFSAAEVGAEGADEAGVAFEPEVIAEGTKTIYAVNCFLRES